jgi:hypothetical protein
VRKTVNVPISSDRGMCGGVNTGVAKLANACIAIDTEGVHCLNLPPRMSLLPIYMHAHRVEYLILSAREQCR